MNPSFLSVSTAIHPAAPPPITTKVWLFAGSLLASFLLTWEAVTLLIFDSGIFTTTLPFSIVTGYVGIEFWPGAWIISPVLTSKAAACQGHTTLYPSKYPICRGAP